MDIQVSSNFERMLWVMNDGDGAADGRAARALPRVRPPAVDPDEPMERWITPAFRAGRSTDAEVLAEIAPRPRRDRDADRPAHGDGHDRRSPRCAGAHPVVTMATAHPAKFPDAVERATGIRPPLPEHLADLFDRPERTETIPNDLAVVEDYVARVSRVG